MRLSTSTSTAASTALWTICTTESEPGCPPQIMVPPATCSGSAWFETVLVMKTAENRFGDDSVAVANPMAGRHRRAVERIRNAGSKAHVRTPTIVMRDPRLKDASQMVLAERNHPVQAFAPNRADQAFAERVRLRRLGRCLENGQPHRRDGAIDAVRVNAVAVVNEEADLAEQCAADLGLAGLPSRRAVESDVADIPPDVFVVGASKGRTAEGRGGDHGRPHEDRNDAQCLHAGA